MATTTWVVATTMHATPLIGNGTQGPLSYLGPWMQALPNVVAQYMGTTIAPPTQQPHVPQVLIQCNKLLYHWSNQKV
jgi:hypothetical protein